ncbi:MAG: hypothetical protein AAFV53_31445 [Myxococcota bacterium]
MEPFLRLKEAAKVLRMDARAAERELSRRGILRIIGGRKRVNPDDLRTIVNDADVMNQPARHHRPSDIPDDDDL